MRKWIFIAAASLMSIGSFSFADEAPDCFVQLETQFFQPAVVQQALSLYNVPQSAWQNITNDLQGQTTIIQDRMRRKASGMRPNPLRSPFNKRTSGELLRSTLYESLVKVLDRYGIRNEVVRQGIFQSLREHNADLLKVCVDEDVKVMK